MAAEMESIETFVEFLCDDDRSSCTLQELRSSSPTTWA